MQNGFAVAMSKAMSSSCFEAFTADGAVVLGAAVKPRAR
jgi:hypothetical protein